MKSIIVACVLALGFGSAVAAQYPVKPIRIIIGFPAGTAADAVVRIVAQQLSEVLGQPVLVDNKPGADGAIAGELAARATPDGYTLLAAGNTQMLGAPILRKDLPYDPLGDFASITPLVKFSFFLVVHPGVPAKTPLQLVEYARANRGNLNYATGNVIGVLATAQLMTLGKLAMAHVPYKGEPLAVPDLLTGRVHMMFGTGAITAPLVKEGRLRALATLLPARSPLLPEVPTIAEAGMPELSVVPWCGLFGPSKMPKEIVEQLSRVVNGILQRPDVLRQFARLGVEASGATPAEFAAFLEQQLADWRKAAREAGLVPE